jgi:hypothetical protein
VATLRASLDVPADSGPLEVTTRLLDDGRELSRRTVSVTPTRKPSVVRRARDFVTEHAIAVLAVVLLGALFGCIAVTVRYRRRLAAVTSRAAAVEPPPAEPAGEPLAASLVARMYAESKENHRRLLHLLAEHPGRWFSTAELAELLGTQHGARAVAGMMGAFGRRAADRYDGQKPWRSRVDPESQKSRHTMDAHVASTIRALAEPGWTAVLQPDASSAPSRSARSFAQTTSGSTAA